MRIIAGTLGGRQLVSPKTAGTRPMTDKVRAALFDILGSVEGFRVLDAYAGSGALGFEALSRGAAQVVALELARAAVKTIQTNQENLDMSWGYSLYPISVESWLARLDLTATPRFDLVMADPPYDQLKSDVIEKLGALVAPGGWLVVSQSSRLPELVVPRMIATGRKVYGDATLGFYKPA